ncbi:MAG: hypothetical protein KTR29_20010 [Rhodothermaceae bacterium]|nr:hypothetical protein [Rhodothermaceae bacterium]
MTRFLPALLVSLLPFSWPIIAQTNQAKNALLGIGSFDLIDPGLHCEGIERQPGSRDFVSDFSPLSDGEASNEFVKTGQEAVFVYEGKTYQGYVDAPYCYALQGECLSDSELLWSYTVPFGGNGNQSSPPVLVSLGDFIPAGLEGVSMPMHDSDGLSCAGLYLEPWPNPWDGAPQGYRQQAHVPEGPTQCMTIYSSDSAHVQVLGNVQLKPINEFIGPEAVEKYSYSEGHFDGTWIADMLMFQLSLSVKHGNHTIESVIQFQPDQYQEILNAMHSRLQDWISGSRKRTATLYYNPEIDKHVYILFGHGPGKEKYYTLMKIDHLENSYELLEQRDPKKAWCH